MESTQFTFSADFRAQFNAVQAHARNNVLCQHCSRMVRNSRIIHQTPKVDWRGPDGLTEPLPSELDVPKVEVFEHYRTLGALKASSQSCHLCALLSAYDPEFPELTRSSSDDKTYVMKVFRADLHAEGPGLLKVDIRGVRHSGATYLMDGQPNAWDESTLASTRTDHHKVLELAKQWLNGCLATHDVCHKRSHPAENWTLPTRLVKVTGFRTNVFSTKLCIGKDLPAGTRYLTLSHCWGGAEIVKLTQDSLLPFLGDIPLQSLPQNFKDAAAITLFLGYEYIWIDSLCIIQDSTDDWKREAATMGNVYHYSLCTIAALGATDPSGGCFMERNSLSFIPCQLFPDSTTRTGVYAENWRDPSPNSHQKSNRETLLTRGWVLQESALSPRTLYFGSQMIYWGCTVADGSEMRQTLLSSTMNENIKGRLHSLLDKIKSGDYNAWAQGWWNIVTDYTSCNLSFHTDRWPAISGLVTILEGNSSSRLVHGLWEINLPVELLWKVINPQNVERLEGEIPSWSWLSVKEPVYKMGFGIPKYFQMDAAVSLQKHPQNDSKLFVRGRMVRLTWNIQYHGDGRRTYSLRFSNSSDSGPPASHGHWNPDTHPQADWETWALRFVADDRVMEEAGLVVRRVERPDGDTWTRVGTYHVQLGGLHNGRSIWDLRKMQTITLE